MLIFVRCGGDVPAWRRCAHKVQLPAMGEGKAV